MASRLLQRRPIAVFLPLVVLAAAIIRGATHGALQAPDITVPRAVVLDVGQGDAILLDGPGDGAEVLVDGGPDGSALIRALGRKLGRDRTLDLVVLTHPHADHVAGLVELLDRYDVERVLLTGIIHTTATYERFLAAVRDRGVPTTVAVAGQTYDVGPFHLDVLAPLASLEGTRVENLNSSSIVMMATVGSGSPPPLEGEQSAPRSPEGEVGEGVGANRILLTGDAEVDVEAAMVERYCADRATDAPCDTLRADVLKAGHHGSETSSTDAFLRVVVPQHAIISVGERNDYGHPHRRALKRLARVGATIWRTDDHGDVTATFVPDGLRVEGER